MTEEEKFFLFMDYHKKSKEEIEAIFTTGVFYDIIDMYVELTFKDVGEETNEKLPIIREKLRENLEGLSPDEVRKKLNIVEPLF